VSLASWDLATWPEPWAESGDKVRLLVEVRLQGTVVIAREQDERECGARYNRNGSLVVHAGIPTYRHER